MNVSRFDSDNDGVINGKELGKILRHIGHNPTEAEIQEMMAVADKDGTGTLDIIEFLQMMRGKVKDENMEKEINEAFQVFDIDGNGYIDRRELGHMMRFIGEPISQQEIDASRTLSFIELTRYSFRIFWMRRTETIMG